MSKAKRRPSPPPATRDLVVLAADKDAAQAIEGLLGRAPSLQIRAVGFDIVVHPQHDPGCFRQSPGLLTVFQKTHAHALVVFDREGCGQEHVPREQLEALVEAELSAAGWRNRSAAVVIDPELERWVWSRSPHVSTALGWVNLPIDLHRWLVENQFLAEATPGKPDRPKEAMQAVLRHVRKPRSSALYRTLAGSVSLATCQDPAFQKFRQTLRAWFPA